MDNFTAERRLLAAGNDIISQHRLAAEKRASIFTYLFRIDVLVSILFSVALLAFFIQESVVTSSRHPRAVDALVVAFLILICISLNAVIFWRETRLTKFEMSTRLQHLLDQLKARGLGEKQDIKLPTNIPSVSIARVIRSGSLSYYPFNLLVEEDVIQMAFGDKAPCTIKYCSPDGTPSQEDIVLRKGDILKPSHFGNPMNPSIVQEAKLHRGQYYFKLLETPLVETLQSALQSKRPETVISHQLKLLFQFLTSRVMWIVLVGSFIVNIIRYSVLSTGDVRRREEVIDFFFVAQFYALLPLLPLSLPCLLLVSRSYGNAQIVCLLEALQSSKKEFKDEEDIDEFDAAPPPTKDVVTDWSAVWKFFLDQLIRVDVSFLARTTGLVESLANTTVICSIDREGSLSMPYPSIDSLFFIGESNEPVVLDIKEEQNSNNGIRFEDRDWTKYISCLKPLGLNFLMNTQCGSTGRRKIENHRKSNIFCIDGRVKPARQTCLCRIGREIGFNDDDLARFSRQSAIHWYSSQHRYASQKEGPDYHFEIPSSNSQVLMDSVTGYSQLLSDGNAELILESCVDYWNGRTLEVMTEATEKKIWEFYQNSIYSDMQVIGYSYRPIPNSQTVVLKNASIDRSGSHNSLLDPNASCTSSYQDTAMKSSPLNPAVSSERLNGRLNAETQCHDLLKAQTFLGMAALNYQPKPNVIDFIEDLDLAGIRYVYFSQAPERESKAYAERLGLEIGWNCCILLSSPDGNGNGYLELHDMKAQLPRGVENIRSHIKNVDDVPLLVSLFAECSPYSTREMVKIFQEHGEVVCCIGSSLNEMNVDCFATADIAVAVDPFTVLKSREVGQGPLSSLSLGSGFTTSPCALKLHFDTSLYSLSQLIREARTLAESSRQGFVFLLSSQITLSCIIFLSYVLFLPPVLTGYQILWLVFFILPLQALPFLFTGHDPDVMTSMPVKNNGHLKDKWRFVSYFILRFSLVIICCLAVFILSLFHFAAERDAAQIFLRFGKISWLQFSSDELWSLLYSQNIMMFAFVFMTGTGSGSFLYRTRSILMIPPWKNRVWIVSSLLSMIFQILFSVISLIQGPWSLSTLPWYMYLIVFGLGMVNIPVHEVVKAHDRERWIRFQKFLKLQFNTKLGMHSPL